MLDIYSTMAQLAAIEQMPKESTFLWDVFVKEEGVVEEEKAIYDYRKGALQMAPVVHKNTGGVVMGRTGYETREFDFCCIAPERVIEAHQLKSRFFGEKVLGSMNATQREKKMLAQDLVDMRKAIQRRREWMARQLLLTGKLEIFKYTDEGRDKTATMHADFGFTQNFTPDTNWGTTGAKINDDLKKITDLVCDEGMGDVDIILMAPDVASAMESDELFMKQLDNRRMAMGEIKNIYRGMGLRYVGQTSDGKDMYSLSAKFVDDDGLLKPFIPSGKLIAGSHGMLKCIHGPVIQVEDEGAAAQHKAYVKREVPLRYGSINSNAIKNRLTSCPALMPYNVDGWCVATVL